MPQRGFALVGILILVLLLAAVTGGVFLATHPTILKSHASTGDNFVTLWGQVKDAAYKNLSGVEVVVYDYNSQQTQIINTSSNGSYTTNNFIKPGDKYSLKITKIPDGYDRLPLPAIYENQIAGDKDCAIQCNFIFPLPGNNQSSEVIDTLDFTITKHLDKLLVGTGFNYTKAVCDKLKQAIPCQENPLETSQTVEGSRLYLGPSPNRPIDMTWDNNFIYLLEDRSASPNYSYTFTPGYWLKRQMRVGEEFEMANNYEQALDADCKPVNQVDDPATGIRFQSGPFPYRMKLLAHIPNFYIGGDLGTQDVMVYEYAYGKDFGYAGKEINYYSRDYGWIWWEGEGGTTLERSIQINHISKDKVAGPLSNKSTCLPQLNPDQITISGHVLDKTTNQPLTQPVQITGCGLPTVTTDATSKFTIQSVPVSTQFCLNAPNLPGYSGPTTNIPNKASYEWQVAGWNHAQTCQEIGYSPNSCHDTSTNTDWQQDSNSNYNFYYTPIANPSPSQSSSGALKGDFNNDGGVGIDDLVILLSHYGTQVPINTLGDMNGDGKVDATDFVSLYNLIK